MPRIGWITWTALGALLLGGCASGPLQENPLLIQTDKAVSCENPLFVNYGTISYPLLYDNVLDIVSDYFDIGFSNRYDGRIETFPKVMPGLGQPWKPGTPDLYQRALAAFQSMRYRCIVVIKVADPKLGGYIIDVRVLKELEDIAVPTAATAGSASFNSFPTVERQYEVVDASLVETNWIPIDREGQTMRDHALEQVILERIAKMDLNCAKKP